MRYRVLARRRIFGGQAIKSYGEAETLDDAVNLVARALTYAWHEVPLDQFLHFEVYDLFAALDAPRNDKTPFQFIRVPCSAIESGCPCAGQS